MHEQILSYAGGNRYRPVTNCFRKDCDEGAQGQTGSNLQNLRAPPLRQQKLHTRYFWDIFQSRKMLQPKCRLWCYRAGWPAEKMACKAERCKNYNASRTLHCICSIPRSCNCCVKSLELYADSGQPHRQNASPVHGNPRLSNEDQQRPPSAPDTHLSGCAQRASKCDSSHPTTLVPNQSALLLCGSSATAENYPAHTFIISAHC